MKNLIAILSLLLIGSFASASIEVQVQASPMTTQDRTVSRYSYYFGRVLLNSPAYADYKVTNTGTTNLTFQSATIGGAGYDAVHNCTGVLEPGQKCSFEIRFMPFLTGIQVGRFILSFVEDEDLVVDLWGEGYRL
jgi:hypothetical protein